MASTASSSPFIKDEFDDFSSRIPLAHAPPFDMSPSHFTPFGQPSGGINPNDLSMDTNGDYNNPSSHSNGGFSKGISTFDDDELIDSLGDMDGGHFGQSGPQNGQDFGLGFDLSSTTFSGPAGASTMSPHPHQISGYSHTPEGDPIQSPFVHNFNQAHFQRMQAHPHLGNLIQSPTSYTGSPMLAGEMGDGSPCSQQRPRLGALQQRRSSTTKSPLTPQTAGIASLNIGSASQPIRTSHARHAKTLSGQWEHTPSSLVSFPGSDFGSPVQGMHSGLQIADVLKGTSMPTKLGGGLASGVTSALHNSQEAKKKRRRESHNQVERRRRDNINERINDLSQLIPNHRLEDDKLRKFMQNNSPMSPTLAGLSAPPSGLSPPSAPGMQRRNTAGTITTGIPLDKEDKGPNKGDILNGAVGWMQDLMWMLHLQLQQQEELANLIHDLGGVFPFEPTESERRMQTELSDALLKTEASRLNYTRHPGSGLRVPKHTDLKGDALGASGQGQTENSLSPDNQSNGDGGHPGVGGPGQYWSGHNSGGSGAGSITFKEEDEYGMDLTH